MKLRQCHHNITGARKKGFNKIGSASCMKAPIDKWV